MSHASVLQSMLDPAGPQAAHIARLWWLMFWVTTVIFVIVMGVLAGAVLRARRGRPANVPGDDDAGRSGIAPLSRESERAVEPALFMWVSIGVGATIAILFVLFVASLLTGRAVASLGASSAVTIKVTGHQWWWEIEYLDAAADRHVKTANEIHIPVGRPVVLTVTSSDVIHSFWVPNLHGKRDLIPGYTTAIWIQADRPGVYRGQCAEFCGHEHAKMALFVTAEGENDFERWLDSRRQPAVEPASDQERRGRDVFLHTTCTQCHAIRGTIAGATLGPDLTHIAARDSLGAGTLPNTTGHLAGWVLDSQSIKPGNLMPPNAVRGEEFQALLAYLGSLK